MKINSSNISEIDHDAGGLVVTFQNGRKYRYPSADSDIFDSLVVEANVEGGSVGKAFNRIVRGTHEGYEVDA